MDKLVIFEQQGQIEGKPRNARFVVVAMGVGGMGAAGLFEVA
jgi:hypothetical protein